MPAKTELWKAHDVAQVFQDKLELLPGVERAFVHIDHETEHRPVSYFIIISIALCCEGEIGMERVWFGAVISLFLPLFLSPPSRLS